MFFFYCSRNESGIKFRQLTDGKHFIQLIYDINDTIRDCEYISQRDQVHEFLKTFKHELGQLVTTSNLTVESLDNKTLPVTIKKWFNYQHLRDLCQSNHELFLKRLNQTHNETNVITSQRYVFIL